MGEVNSTDYALLKDANKVKISATDTTAGYLQDSLVAGSGITITKNNSGGNETLTIAATASGLDQYVKSQSGDSTADYLSAKLVTTAQSGSYQDLALTKKNSGANEYLEVDTSPSISARMPWDANDLAVFYFDEPAGSGYYYNQVTGNYDLTCIGAVDCGWLGLYSTCVHFPDILSNTSNTILTTNAAMFEPSGSTTISYWVNHGSQTYANGQSSYNWCIVRKGSGVWPLNFPWWDAGSTTMKIHFDTGTPAQSVLGMNWNSWRLPIYGGGWYHYALVFDSGAKTITFYVNGQIHAGPVATTGSSPTWVGANYMSGPWQIGLNTGSNNWNKFMLISDFRISATARSQAYLREQYMRGMGYGGLSYKFTTDGVF